MLGDFQGLNVHETEGARKNAKIVAFFCIIH